MRIFFVMLLLGLHCAALQTSYRPPRNLALTGSDAALPVNVQLQNMWQNYSQEQELNPKADAEADAPANLLSGAMPKTNRALKTSLISGYDALRNLEDEPAAADAPAETPAEAPAEAPEGAPAENHADPGEHLAADESAETVDSIIDRLLKRVSTLDDKIDHLLFHNHHDLAGMTAYYTPYGVQMLPSKKPKDSVDQKLKMIDYMHNLGGGYNPMLHTMLPYYLGHDDKTQAGVKMDGLMGMGMNGGSRKKKVL